MTPEPTPQTDAQSPTTRGTRDTRDSDDDDDDRVAYLPARLAEAAGYTLDPETEYIGLHPDTDDPVAVTIVDASISLAHLPITRVPVRDAEPVDERVPCSKPVIDADASERGPRLIIRPSAVSHDEFIAAVELTLRVEPVEFAGDGGFLSSGEPELVTVVPNAGLDSPDTGTMGTDTPDSPAQPAGLTALVETGRPATRQRADYLAPTDSA